MKKHRKLNLRKLSIAKLDTHLVREGIKGGTDADTNDLDCKTDETYCATSTKTITEEDYTLLIAVCV
jgi:hypothetical protein